MSNAQVNESGLLAAIDHVHRAAQDCACRFGEFPAVLGLPQGVGAHHANAFGLDTLEELGETRKAFQATLDSLFSEKPFEQACAQLHFFCQHLNRSHFTVFDARDNQVKGVAAQVYGS